MLQTIREYTQGWIAGTIISIIILTFALWGIHSYFIGGANNSVVAQVNSIEITKEQLAVAYERLRRQAQAQYGSNSSLLAKDETTLKRRALQALIDIEVLKQASLVQGFRISNGQIDNYLQSMPEFQVDGQFSVERFQEILSSTLLSTSEFLDLIKTNLLVDQPKLGIIFTSFALPDETNYTISLVNQERDIDYINLPLHYFISQPIIISAEKIKAYYDQHQRDFMTPEQVNVEYIELSLNDLSTRINPTDAMLKSFYNENINSYSQPTAWKLADIEVSVAPGATQEEVAAAQNKVDAIAKVIKNGGDLAKIAHENAQNLTGQNWMTLNQVPAELQKAVAQLTTANQVSDSIKTSKGFVIIKVVDMKGPKMQTFDTVKGTVKDTYIHQRAEEKYAALRDQLADVTYEHPDSLQLAAKTLNLPIKTSELFSRDKSGKDISQYKKVRDTAFSHDVLTLQNNSDVIQLNPESVIVLRVKSHIASALLPLNGLNGISKQIEDKLKAQAAEERAAKFAEDLKAKLQSGADPQQVASVNKVIWNKMGSIGRYSTKVDTAILDAAFSLPNPSIAQNKVIYGITRLPNNGYAIIALKSVKEGTVADKKQYTVFAEQVQNSEGLLEYELYKQSQTSKATISIQ
jgi:peptidyl-prolyl cis-trans isomerase D